MRVLTVELAAHHGVAREKSFIHQFIAVCLHLNRGVSGLVHPDELVRLGSHQVADQAADHRSLYLGIGCLVSSIQMS